jgi:dTDP-4-dehydrorhamnose 3,5-epimerase-like enzyme
MAYIENLSIFDSEIGNLNVFEGLIPDEIKRVYYITKVPKNAVRGLHRHHKTWQALICIAGNCSVFIDNGTKQEVFNLNTNGKCLVIEPEDWHFMNNFSEDAVLLVIANQKYNKADYIDEPYSKEYLSYL